MENDLRGVFAANVKALLESRNENTVSAAKLTGMDQKTIWSYCHSLSSNPTLTKIETLAEAFSVPPYRLLLPASFDQNATPSAANIINQLHKLNDRQIQHVAELVDLLASQ